MCAVAVDSRVAWDESNTDCEDHDQKTRESRHESPADHSKEWRQINDVCQTSFAIEIIEASRHHPRKDDNQTHADDAVEEWDVSRHDIR